LHKYLYAYDSPMVYTDPWGEYGWDDFKKDAIQLNDIATEFTKGVTKDTAEMGANLVTLGGYSGLKQGLQDNSAYNGPLGGLYAYGRGVRNFMSLGYYDAKDKWGHTKELTGVADFERIKGHVEQGSYLEAAGDVLVGSGKVAGLVLGAEGAIGTAGKVATIARAEGAAGVVRAGVNVAKNQFTATRAATESAVVQTESGLTSMESAPELEASAAKVPEPQPPMHALNSPVTVADELPSAFTDRPVGGNLGPIEVPPEISADTEAVAKVIAKPETGATQTLVADVGSRVPAGAPPVVIGENMVRVARYANKIGGVTIGDWLAGRTWTSELNDEFIATMKAEGREFVDIGPDFGRRLRNRVNPSRGRPASKDYAGEREQLQGYGQYSRVYARQGKFQGGVPGLDLPSGR
jgi:hypothetical protein